MAVHDVRGPQADATVGRIEAEGGQAFTVLADARDDAALDAMTTEVVARFGGGLDIAVNNVGMYGSQRPGPVETLGGEHWRDLLDQNLVITALAGAAEAHAMIAAGRGGVILNVSSGETTRPAPFMAAYAAAKAGINHLTQTMAVELGPHGIRVLAIAPGTTLTETVRDAFDDDHVDRAGRVDAAATHDRGRRAGPTRRVPGERPGPLRDRAADPGRRRCPPVTHPPGEPARGGHRRWRRPMTDAVAIALGPVRDLLRLDGADIELVAVDDAGTAHLRLLLVEAGCAECVLPKDHARGRGPPDDATRCAGAAGRRHRRPSRSLNAHSTLRRGIGAAW